MTMATTTRASALLCFLIAPLAHAGTDDIVALATPAMQGYRACMREHVRDYAPRAKSVEDAITAAHADCDSLRAYLTGRIAEGLREFEATPADRADAMARQAVQGIDDGLRPDLARTALSPAP